VTDEDRIQASMSPAGERLGYAALALVIIGAGLLCRWPRLGLPWPVAKYAGSTLWGAMVYAGLRMIRPRARISTTVIVAVVISACVEGSRLYQQPWLDAFRQTLSGKLLLGRYFSPWDLVAYVAGIVALALADARAARTCGVA
jgi:hypothetical protein